MQNIIYIELGQRQIQDFSGGGARDMKCSKPVKRKNVFFFKSSAVGWSTAAAPVPLDPPLIVNVKLGYLVQLSKLWRYNYKTKITG